MSFHVQKWQDISWLDVPSKKEANKKGGEKTMGGNRKKRKRKKEEKKKRKKKGEVTKQKERKGEGRGEEDRMKNRKEEERKKSWDQVFNKRKYCVGTEPSALVYISILVTSTNHGHDGSVVSALASQAKGRGSNPLVALAFLSNNYFLSSLSNLRGERIKSENHHAT